MQQNISTALGASVIIILAITAGAFLWQSEQGQPSLDQAVSYVTVQKPPRVAPLQDVSMMGKEQKSTTVTPPQDPLPLSVSVATQAVSEKDLVGMWKPKVNTAGDLSEQYSIEKGQHIYKSFSFGKLDSQGTWSMDSNGMLSIKGKDGAYTLSVDFNQAKDEITITDEGSQSVLVKVALP